MRYEMEGRPNRTEVAYDLAAHLDRVQVEMDRQQLDYLVLTPSADWYYLTGVRAAPSHRLAAVIVPASGVPHVIAPQVWIRKWGLDKASLAVDAWAPPVSPIDLVRSQLSGAGRAPVVGVGGDMSARHLLALLNGESSGKYITADAVMQRARMVKTPEEIELLRAAGRAADAVCEELRNRRLTDMSEIEVHALIRELDVEKGHDEPAPGGGVWIGEKSGDIQSPRTDRRARLGDPIQVDLGGMIRHYNSDISRVLHIGPPTDEYLRVYNTVRDAQKAAVAAAVTGSSIRDVYDACRAVIEANGYGPHFGVWMGHGIGLEHEELPPVAANGDHRLEPGMVITIEPGIYIRGSFGARVEDAVVVTETGPERLTHFTRELCIVN